MAKKTTIKKKYIIILCLLFVSLSSSAQNYSDQEIGFDSLKIISLLKNRGVNDSDDLFYQVEQMREQYRIQYIDTQNHEIEILQKIKPKGLLRTEAIIDIPQNEKEALKALFNSVGGYNWRNNNGWLFSNPVASFNSLNNTGWYGITVSNGHVTSLILNSNRLKGKIPKEIGELKYLKILNLAANELSGSLPEEIGELADLESLNLAVNKLSERLPMNIYNLKFLKYLLLYDNAFIGEISSKIKNLSILVELYGNQNQLSGLIPPEIGDLIKLNILDLRLNQFTGEIPLQIGQLQNLATLHLSNNNFSGSIPKEIGNLQNLNRLALSYNKLVGTIPIEIEKISIGFLNLEYNLLQGKWPKINALQQFNIKENNFRFIDFAEQFIFNTTKLKNNFYYSPQSKTDTSTIITSSIGDSLTLVMCEDGRFTSSDTFQWYKNSTPITGATSRIYTISNLKTADAGQYSCKSYHNSNPDMSPLVLEREPITLKVENCTPVIGAIKVVN